MRLLRRTPGRLFTGMSVVMVAALLVVGGPGSSASPQAERTAERTAEPAVDASTPNIIVFLVDDMDDFSCAETPKFLPRSSVWLRDQGRCFENASVTDPVCCPSRSVFMTGQEPHNNGVRRQVDAPKLRVRDTLQFHMRAAGIRTYGTGKMLNGVPAFDYESGKRDSGFERSDFWPRTRYYHYKLWSDEEHRAVWPADRVHTTVRTGDFGASFIAEMAGRGDPFYAYLGFKAPHTDNSPGKHIRRFPTPTPANAHRPVPPLRWDPEHHRRDKLRLFRGAPHDRPYYERFHKARVRALYDIDDQMARVFNLLRSTGVLENTVVVFTSDNGYHLGQNGWETKGVPYQASIDVPMLIRYPAAFGSGVVDTRDVSLIDLAPTFYEILDLEPGHLMDGHSLVGTRHRRHGNFFEYTAERNALSEKEDLGANVSPGLVPSWAMYRQGKRSYIEFYRSDGRIMAREFYADRGQKDNLLFPAGSHRVSPETVAKFQRRLDAARTCAGTREAGSRHPCP